MELVKVDAIDSQILEAVFTVATQSFGTSVEKARRGRFFNDTPFGRNEEIVWIRGERICNQSFVPARPISACRVDKSNAQFYRVTEQLFAGFPIDVRAIIVRLAGQSHGAVTESRNSEIASDRECSLHKFS